MIEIKLDQEQIEIVRHYTKNSERGGISRIREHEDRMKHLKEDGYTGHAGNAALSIFLTGRIDLYVKTRQVADQNPYKGDGGPDLLGTHLDIKTSRMRCGRNYPYHLYVRDAEYHEEITYILALMDVGIDDAVFLVGYCDAIFLPQPINGRRSLVRDELNPMSSFFGIYTV